MTYGLTLSGFVIKPFEIIQAELQASVQAIFGNDIDISDQSIIGQFINNLAVQESNLWELAQYLYSGFNPDTAVGSALDDVCSRVNISRLPATSSIVIEILYGTGGTVLSAGHLISQEGTNLQLSLLANTTIQASNSVDITIDVSNVQNNYTYQITINGTIYSYVSGVSAAAVDIIAGLLAALGTIANITISSPTTITLRLFASDGKTLFNISLGSNLEITILGSPGSYSAVIPGAVSFPANSITQIVNAINGLNSVNNLIPAVIGRNLESDDNLRARRLLALRSLGKGTDISIAQNILQNVTGVTAVYVYSNRTDFIDSSNRPPHSFETVVTGGTDADVANMIWQCMPSGIQTYGNISYVISDTNGQNHTIYFSRPENVYIWLKIALSFYSEEDFPMDGDVLITKSIVNWSLTEFNPGIDVILQRILSPIYTIPGISNAVITIAATLDLTPPSPGDYSSIADTPIGSSQIAVFNIEQISITP